MKHAAMTRTINAGLKFYFISIIFFLWGRLSLLCGGQNNDPRMRINGARCDATRRKEGKKNHSHRNGRPLQWMAGRGGGGGRGEKITSLFFHHHAQGRNSPTIFSWHKSPVCEGRKIYGRPRWRAPQKKKRRRRGAITQAPVMLNRFLPRPLRAFAHGKSLTTTT